MWKRRTDGVEHVFTQEAREAQLGVLELACSGLADLLANHEEARWADEYRARAEHAAQLRAEGFTRDDLIQVGSQFPHGPGWLNLKARDGQAPPTPWQREVARLHEQAHAAALDLRTVASLPQP